MAAHLALGLTFLTMLMCFLFLGEMRYFFVLKGLFSDSSRLREIDESTANLVFVLLFCGIGGCFSWMGFIQDLKLLRRKSPCENMESPDIPRRGGDAE